MATKTSLKKYLPRIEEFLQKDKDDLTIEKTPWGFAVIKGNLTTLSKGIEALTVGNYVVNRNNDRVLHERVLIIEDDIPIRSHEEEDGEVGINIGDNSIWIQRPSRHRKELPANLKQSHYIYRGPGIKRGFYHGFRVEDTGLLYLVKILKPEFVKGNSFRTPKNTYQKN